MVKDGFASVNAILAVSISSGLPSFNASMRLLITSIEVSAYLVAKSSASISVIAFNIVILS